MSTTSPANNMAIIANAAELTRLTVSSMMSNQKVRDLFGSPAIRANVYAAVVQALHKRIDGEIRNLPTGQFNKTVLTGAHQSGAGTPNVNL